jgi:hypothetical protein
MLAICASVQPTRASRVTAVPLRLLNVRPLIPAALRALKNEERNQFAAHGRPSLLTRMIGERRGVASSIA